MKQASAPYSITTAMVSSALLINMSVKSVPPSFHTASFQEGGVGVLITVDRHIPGRGG